ncbi:MAG: hypothetical protein JW728_07650 [Candidatus Aureabacteria bacterium]|nr:hypothetical protein [Candidatus Auribacterota bacterium]
MAVLCKCTKCGNECKMDWKEGIRCPVCSSNTLYPVVKVDAAENGPSHAKQNSIEAIIRKNRDKIIIYSLVIVIGFSWLILFLRLSSKKSAVIQQKTEDSMKGMQLYECQSCKYSFYAPIGEINVKCPRCGREKGQPLFKCKNCGTVFTSSTRGKILCPSCESESVEGYYTK